MLSRAMLVAMLINTWVESPLNLLGLRIWNVFFPTAGNEIALQNFYEELKTIPSIRSDPLFWLQYAMARLSLGDLDLARRYFEQSYSIADRRKFDTYPDRYSLLSFASS